MRGKRDVVVQRGSRRRPIALTRGDIPCRKGEDEADQLQARVRDAAQQHDAHDAPIVSSLPRDARWRFVCQHRGHDTAPLDRAARRACKAIHTTAINGDAFATSHGTAPVTTRHGHRISAPVIAMPKKYPIDDSTKIVRAAMHHQNRLRSENDAIAIDATQTTFAMHGSMQNRNMRRSSAVVNSDALCALARASISSETIAATR